MWWLFIEKLQWNAQGYIWKFCNEIHWLSNEKLQWNILGYQWKIPMKGTRYLLKNRNEIPRDTIEILQWNTQGYNWKICNEMHWVSNEKLQWNILRYQWKIPMKHSRYLLKISGNEKYVAEENKQIFNTSACWCGSAKGRLLFNDVIDRVEVAIFQQFPAQPGNGRHPTFHVHQGPATASNTCVYPDLSRAGFHWGSSAVPLYSSIYLSKNLRPKHNCVVMPNHATWIWAKL